MHLAVLLWILQYSDGWQLQIPNQNSNGKPIIRISNIQIPCIFIHHITDILHPESMGTLVFFSVTKPSFFTVMGFALELEIS